MPACSHRARTPRSAIIVIAALTATSASLICASQVSAASPATSAAAQTAEYAPGHVLVHYKSGVSSASQVALERANGASRLSSISDIGVEVLKVPDGAEQRVIDALKHSDKVQYAERDGVLDVFNTPNDPYYPVNSYKGGQWGDPLVKAPQAWDTTTGSVTVTIAVIDTGIATGHPDLNGQVETGYNVLTGTTDTTDSNGHGTEVAGVIGATANNGKGIAGYCWKCRLLPVKVSNDGSMYMSDVATGVTWAVDHGARVLNLSLGSTSQYNALSSAVTYARSKDAIVVAAAGNSGTTALTYPAADTGVISVAASNQSDQLYSYSNYGSWVDVAAPGQNLTTTLTDPSTGAQWGYAPIGGTSMAAPVVSGIAGLLLSSASNASATTVQSALLDTTDPISGTHVVGNGRVNAANAMAAVTGAATPVMSATPTTSPSPTASPSPTPTTNPSPAPSPSVSSTTAPTATATPTSTATTTTTSFSGSLTKSGSQTWAQRLNSGGVTSALSFNSRKCSALTLDLADAAGHVLAAASGANPVTLDAAVTGGDYAWRVSGSCRVSYTLSITSSS